MVKQEVMHWIYEQDGSDLHQLILPVEYRTQGMKMLHDKQGHQVTEKTMAFRRERFTGVLSIMM